MGVAQSSPIASGPVPTPSVAPRSPTAWKPRVSAPELLAALEAKAKGVEQGDGWMSNFLVLINLELEARDADIRELEKRWEEKDSGGLEGKVEAGQEEGEVMPLKLEVSTIWRRGGGVRGAWAG